jgi:hypothetical protein
LTDFADLELSLHRREGNSYNIEMRLTQPNSDADIRLGQGQSLTAQIEPLMLQDLIITPDEYGNELAKSLFSDPNVLAAWAQARATAQSLQKPLRLRLLIGPSAGELNSLYWEALRDPQDKSQITTNENILFSRYLSSSDWRPVKLRPKGDLKALAVVSNPSDLANYKLAAVDVPGELARAKEALGNIPITELPANPDEKVTLNNLIARLRDGYDILYLAAHGTVATGEATVWLQQEDGTSAKTPAAEIVTRLRELQNPPRLVVLASCQSAGKGNGNALQAFGPQLAQGGIPAVIAMQGNISMDSVKKFMPVFFAELQKDGQIDRALAVARGTVRSAHDFWMPVLFMRLKSGKIWYVPGFGAEGGGFEKWPALINAIQRQAVVPVIGPAMLANYFGMPGEIASKWSDEYSYPLSPHQKSMLPQVAQYLSVQQTPRFPYEQLESYIQEQLVKRFGNILPDDLKNGGQAAGADPFADPFGDPFADPAAAGGAAKTSKTDQMLLKVGEYLRGKDPHEQHRVLAKLPLQIYITTNFDTLMEDALKAEGKQPVSVICPWKESLKETALQGADVMPNADKPMVYHLFGRWDIPDSMVLTQDDYFDFMSGKAKLYQLIPARVRAAVANGALLLTGFAMNDWSFRVFYRAMIDEDVRKRPPAFPRFGIQIALDEQSAMQPERARKYLEKYFGADKFEIYWGDSADFLKDLSAEWAKVAK